MQLKLRAIHELCESEVLRTYLVDTQGLLTVDIASDDSLDEVLAVDVHRQHLVVLTTHNHVALTTLDTGIKRILLLATQPREIAAVNRELLETRQNPTQHLVGIVTLGDNSHLAGVCTQ